MKSPNPGVMLETTTVAYATQEDITALHGAKKLRTLADRDRDGSVDSEAVARALEAASAEIDSYLAARYVTPVDPAPITLRDVAIEIAVYRLANNGAGLTEDVRKRYDDSLRFLRDLAGGRADLPGAQDIEAATVSPIVSSAAFSAVPR